MRALTGVIQDFLFDDPAAEDLHPVTLVHDLKLPRRVGEREEAIDPAVFDV
jgi:hypothetical protein